MQLENTDYLSYSITEYGYTQKYINNKETREQLCNNKKGWISNEMEIKLNLDSDWK